MANISIKNVSVAAYDASNVAYAALPRAGGTTGALTTGALTTTTITTNNNTINAGTGAITCGAATCNGGITTNNMAVNAGTGVLTGKLAWSNLTTIATATTTVPGIVQLIDSVSSTSMTLSLIHI